MSKIAVIYWSGTGNTEAMADLVANAAVAAGASVDKFTASEFNVSSAGDYTACAGLPRRGRRAAGGERVRADVPGSARRL